MFTRPPQLHLPPPLPLPPSLLSFKPADRSLARVSDQPEKKKKNVAAAAFRGEREKKSIDIPSLACQTYIYIYIVVMPAWWL